MHGDAGCSSWSRTAIGASRAARCRMDTRTDSRRRVAAPRVKGMFAIAWSRCGLRSSGLGRVMVRLGVGCGGAVAGLDVDAFALGAEDAQELHRTGVGVAEPVGEMGVEFGDLAGGEDEVLVTEDEA